MPYIVCTALLLPLAGFLFLTAAAFTISRKAAGLIGSGTVGLSFFCFIFLLMSHMSSSAAPFTLVLYKWLFIPELNVDFSLYIDHLSLLMALIVTGVGFLIHIYSIGYMEQDEDIARYFSCMNFFIFMMLTLVLSGNLLLLFIGWEGVGLASYLLIGYYYHRPPAARAATKAFIVNRIGDAGFLLGLLLTFYLFGTSDIQTLLASLGGYIEGSSVLTLLTLLLFAGAIGKSAQLPLHVWLPDAMEGPTPVSALIHAATMVTAGVYLIVRLHPLFMLAPLSLQVIGSVGAVTSLFASLCAIGQMDLKRVLAYSTISQLGLMFVACGAGAFFSAMFHLTTHAFVKATLFLSAGIVVHMMNGSTNMEKMGGLRKILTKTHWLFLIGALSMSGIPPLAAFFSKDLILEQEYLAGYTTLFYIALAASVLTGFYLTRAYCLTFLGVSRTQGKLQKEVHEGPKIMLIPVAILAFLSIVGGFLGCGFCNWPILQNFLVELGKTDAEQELSKAFTLNFEAVLAICSAFSGVGIAALLYTKYLDQLGPALKFLKKSFYFDELYEALFKRPLIALSRFIDLWAEPKLVQGIVDLAVRKVDRASSILQKVQGGEIRAYVAWMVAGMLFLIVYFVF